MISHEEALKTMLERVETLGTQQVPTARCGGRVLAEDVAARLASPPFDKAAMDGYAVRAADVAALPASLALVGESFAGGWPAFEVGPGECAVISTGAPVPRGADMVVMVEHTRALSGGKIAIEELSGPNICPRGEDVREGQVVLRRGRLLTALAAGVAAAAGCDRLTVYRRPSVALVCTGTEVVEPGATVRDGQIYNSNACILTALLEPLSGKFEYLGIVGDDDDAVEAAVRRGLESDILVISGGVSVGPLDLVPGALERLGVETVFHRCAIKPGKPVLFGVRGGSYVFGMPGNPLSCFVVFHVLMRAAVARMCGREDVPPVYRTGVVTHAFRNRPGRKTFRPCRVRTADGRNQIELVESHGSADITGASACSALAVVPADVERVEAGEILEFLEV